MVCEYSRNEGKGPTGVRPLRNTPIFDVTSRAPHAPAPWVTENVWPAIVAVPDREPPVLGATLRRTTPPPEPEAPDLTVTQGTLLTAVQGQPLEALTDTLMFPP